MLKLTAITSVEFRSAEDLESMVRTLPLQPYEVVALLDGDEIVDEEDESSSPGAGKVVHKFKITGKE